jgi:alcohol dehydrogenase
MKALVFDGRLSLRDVAKPLPMPGEALVQVTLAGICGTDREILRGYSGFRGIPGHEFVGKVVECEEKTWLGRRVVGEINITCGQCSWCARGLGRHCPHRTVMGIVKRDGAFAEFAALPLCNLHEVPAGIPDEAAVFENNLAPYSFLKTSCIRSLSSPSSMCASPSTHDPVGLPFLSDNTTRMCGFLRIRLTFQVSGPVRT